MEKTTWADWFASRTIKWNLYISGIFAAAIPVLASLSESDFAALGISPKWVMVGMAAIKVADGMKNISLRAATTAPLAGRALPDK